MAVGLPHDGHGPVRALGGLGDGPLLTNPVRLNLGPQILGVDTTPVIDVPVNEVVPPRAAVGVLQLLQVAVVVVELEPRGVSHVGGVVPLDLPDGVGQGEVVPPHP